MPIGLKSLISSTHYYVIHTANRRNLPLGLAF